MGLKQRGLACLIAIALISAGAFSVPSRAQSAPDDPAFEFQWGLTKVAAQEAWAVGQGQGISVAVLDTGVDLAHEDLDGQVLSGGRDVQAAELSPQDDHGQGTHVSGIIAAATNNKTGVAGIAYRSKILPIKVLDSDGDGFEGPVIEGIRLAIEKKVDVLLVNLHEGIALLDGGARFEAAIRDAWNAGIIPVIPSSHPRVRANGFADAPALVVGGVTREGNDSSYNPGVGAAQWGLSAPGGAGTGDEADIFSSYLPHSRADGLGGSREYGRYVYAAGNIQAAAHVAGAAAILRGLGQTPAQTVERIVSSAADAGPTGRDRTFGVGVLHIGRSVNGLSPNEDPPQVQGTATSAPPVAPGATSGGGTTPPTGNSGSGAVTNGRPATNPGSSNGLIGTPAGADQPADPAPPNAGEGSPEDITGGLALNEGEPMPGRTPVLPLVALLLLMGSATITWALRRRAGETGDLPLNS